MSTVIKTGWLNDKNGDKFAPKTLISQVVATDGTTLEDAIEVKLDEFKNDIASQDHNHDDIYETKEDAQLKYDTITAAKADWNQNDENAIDYIRNRPFYETDLILTSFIPETTLSEYENEEEDMFYMCIYNFDKVIQIGELYNVTFDGILYENLMYDYNTQSLGATYNDLYNNTSSYPFALSFDEFTNCYWIYNKGNASHTIKVEGMSIVTHKIDKKFLPTLVGENVSGKIYTIDETEATASEGAEVFNDYKHNIASGYNSHAEGYSTMASGVSSHAEGNATTASGNYGSHAEGNITTASGSCSHAEGSSTTASGNQSHAEGQNTTASGSCSHTEGLNTTASGHNSHAEGQGTIATRYNSHVQGSFNIEDTSKTYIHIVGNGRSESNRSNAHTLDFDGNAWFAGTIKVGGTEYDNGSEVALKSDLANIDLSKYETKTDSQSKLDEAKAYADSTASTVKNDLLNGAGAAYDTLKELGELIVENKDAIDVLEDVATGKADAVHSHAISEVSGLQSALDGKADVSHGTHVTFDSTNKPKMDGTSAFGTSTSVARADHVHPTDTSRASQTDLDNHIADSTKHITSTERTNWNTAKSHADSAHAPSNAQANVIESIKVNGATQIITNKSVDITVPTDATDIGAAPATHGHAISDITDLQTTLSNAANAIQTNTNSINAHTDRISSLETKIGDGFEEISSEEIAALFAN